MSDVETIIRALPDRFRPDVAGRTKITVQLELTGEGGGVWWVCIADGACTTGDGPADRPDVVLRTAAQDYARIRRGELDPIKATMAGTMTVSGGYGRAGKFAKMFDPEE
jgi:putative sterol carrier protein